MEAKDLSYESVLRHYFGNKARPAQTYMRCRKEIDADEGDGTAYRLIEESKQGFVSGLETALDTPGVINPALGGLVSREQYVSVMDTGKSTDWTDETSLNGFVDYAYSVVKGGSE